MTIEMLIIWLAVGLVAGFLASVVVRGGSSGPAMNIAAGIVGAFIGGFLFRVAGWDAPFGGYAGLVFVAFCGAALLLLMLRAVTWHRPVSH